MLSGKPSLKRALLDEMKEDLVRASKAAHLRHRSVVSDFPLPESEDDHYSVSLI
jgi:hypothetical protein